MPLSRDYSTATLPYGVEEEAASEERLKGEEGKKAGGSVDGNGERLCMIWFGVGCVKEEEWGQVGGRAQFNTLAGP